MNIEKEYVEGLLRKIERLQNERDALAAQVETLKDALGWALARGESKYVWEQQDIDAIAHTLETTPQQCLRDVQAEAVSKFANTLSESLKAVPVPQSDYETNIKMRNSFINILDMCIDEYPAKVRQGGAV